MVVSVLQGTAVFLCNQPKLLLIAEGEKVARPKPDVTCLSLHGIALESCDSVLKIDNFSASAASGEIHGDSPPPSPVAFSFLLKRGHKAGGACFARFTTTKYEQ